VFFSQPCILSPLQALELDALLAAAATVQQGGVRTVSARGVGLYDVISLKDELLKRWVGNLGADGVGWPTGMRHG